MSGKQEKWIFLSIDKTIYYIRTRPDKGRRTVKQRSPQSIMFLPQTAEYALRAMTQIATLQEQGVVRARDLSQMTQVPPYYLSKILRKMVTHGLLIAQKGHGGGFVLARKRADIQLLDVLNAVNCTFEPNHCAFGWGKCDADNPCLLHDHWSNLQHMYQRWAETATLADTPNGESAAP